MKKDTYDYDYALTEVSETSKRGLMSMIVVMLGFTFFSASMISGGVLGAGLTLKEFVI